jgi:hypothetical protein
MRWVWFVVCGVELVENFWNKGYWFGNATLTWNSFGDGNSKWVVEFEVWFSKRSVWFC